jgi:hypothetical protein
MHISEQVKIWDEKAKAHREIIKQLQSELKEHREQWKEAVRTRDVWKAKEKLNKEKLNED